MAERDHPNEWSLRRDIYGQAIIARAEHLSRQGVWVLTCRVNDRLVDQSQSNDPVIELVKMMQRAIGDHVHEDLGETAKPHDESPQELGQTVEPGREPREVLDETGNPHREPPEAGWP